MGGLARREHADRKIVRPAKPSEQRCISGEARCEQADALASAQGTQPSHALAAEMA
jgi:hypothetical protein